MAEPDHIIVKPIPNLSGDGRATAFRFFYIEPKKYETALHNFPPNMRVQSLKLTPLEILL
jgi:hydroxyproline O-arabinosyltransferase